MFAKKLNKRKAIALVSAATSEYLKKLIQKSGALDIAERQEMLVLAHAQAQGIDYLSGWIAQYLDEPLIHGISGAFRNEVEKMLEHNEKQIGAKK